MKGAQSCGVVVRPSRAQTNIRCKGQRCWDRREGAVIHSVGEPHP